MLQSQILENSKQPRLAWVRGFGRVSTHQSIPIPISTNSWPHSSKVLCLNFIADTQFHTPNSEMG